MARLRNDHIPTPALSRRGFLVATAGAGLTFSFLTACETTGQTAASGPAYEPTQWYSMASDGTVTVNVIRAD